MLSRLFAIALNTFRESIRARILYGLLAGSVGAIGYALFLGAASYHQEGRVLANVGSAAASFFSVIVAVITGATSLHREVELKTIFPILTRKLQRHEYVLGKFFGILLTVMTFLATNSALLLSALAAQMGPEGYGSRVVALWVVGFSVLLGGLWKFRHQRVFVMIPWSLAMAGAAYVLAAPSGGERQLVMASMVLSLGEVAIVTSVSMLFSSFSSPFLTAVFSLGLFVIGRRADTLAHIPTRYFGALAKTIGSVLSKIVPNLQLFVPARPLLLGEVAETPLWPYVASSWGVALLYVTLFLVGACAAFRTRDFT
jgi:Cu-processing system permease protein